MPDYEAMTDEELVTAVMVANREIDQEIDGAWERCDASNRAASKRFGDEGMENLSVQTTWYRMTGEEMAAWAESNVASVLDVIRNGPHLMKARDNTCERCGFDCKKA